MWQLPTIVLVFSALVSVALRVALFAVYPQEFAHASLFRALLSGVRFDLKLAVLAFAPCLLFWLLPVRRLRTASAWFAYGILVVLLGFGVADLAYFGEVGRHIGSDVFNIGGDIGFLFATAFTSRLGYTAAALAASALLAFIWNKTVVRIAEKPFPSGRRKRAVQVFLLLPAYVFLARGMVLQGRPLNNIDAFGNNGAGGQAQANLTLNGVLATLQAFQKRQQNHPLHYVDAAAEQKFSEQYPQPFLYQPIGTAQRKNVVLILLESWSFKYIDALSGSRYGATPHMDALIAQSHVWPRFYAAGQRSIVGIQAALTSVPALPDRQPLGFGLELADMSRIAELAGRQGYRTIMMQSSNRRSFHMDGIARALGFQEYYGKEDVPLLRRYPQETPAFGWDYDSLMFFGKQISREKKPFFAFFFSGTTHEPFARPGAEFEIYPHESAGENGFLNTLRYSDWSVAQFMQYASRQEWYGDTIFVFMADHTLNSKTRSADPGERFHIPLIVFSPSWQPETHRDIASQYDILPTFADWMDIKQPVYTFGRSLANPQSKSMPLMLNQGDSSVVLSEHGVATFSDSQMPPNLAPEMQRDVQLVQWRMQEADKRLRANSWVR